MKVPVVAALFLDEVILFRVEVVLAQELTAEIADALQLVRLVHDCPLSCLAIMLYCGKAV